MTQFLRELSASIAAGEVRVVSDEEHRRKHWQQQQLDVMAATRMAIQYTTENLLDLLELIERSQSPHRETVKRQYLMALDLKPRGRK